MIETALTLPNGMTLPNRIAKAAMTEGLADRRNRATHRHETLYRRWAEGGAGLLLTGNVQIDRAHLERPGNIAIEPGTDDEAVARLGRLAAAARAGGGRVWMQLSHAGRQTPVSVNPAPRAPSAIAVALPGRQFGTPVALTEAEIETLPARFAHAAGVAKRAGFDGAQIHAAHGYLLSAFLSPLANRREDRWGGGLENRARLLLAVVDAVRPLRDEGFALSVKLNSADFQRGGFSHEEAVQVARWLGERGLDLLEISGGNYEQPVLIGAGGILEGRAFSPAIASREAYFLDYAAAIRAAVRTPLMVTGGFRIGTTMEAALVSGACDMIGLGRPLCAAPDTPSRILAGADAPAFERRLRVGPGRWLGAYSPLKLVRVLNGFGVQGWFTYQLLRMGDGLDPATRMSVLGAFARLQRNEARAAKALARD